MLRKIIAALICTVCIMTILTGCWDRKELNELGIVMAVGFDMDPETGKILLTSQVVRPGALTKQQGTSKEATYDIVITSGKTIMEAIRNTTKEFDRRTIFSHVKVIVVSEAIAHNGLRDIIDITSRFHEFRTTAWLMVARNCQATEVLSIKHGIENIQASYMLGVIKGQQRVLQASSAQVVDFEQKISGEGNNPVTGVFSIISVKGIPAEMKDAQSRLGLSLSGTAVYKKDKLVGYLEDDETMGYNLLIGKKQLGVNHVSLKNSDSSDISINIVAAKSNIKPQITNGRISFNILVKLEGNISEVGGDTDVSDVAVFEGINERFKSLISDSVNITIDKVQKQLKTDILGLGRALQEEYPKKWENVKNEWDVLFPDVVCKVEVKTVLRRTGLLLRPLTVKSTDN